jgi:N-acetylglucosamine-6-phosphate deacetylase
MEIVWVRCDTLFTPFQRHRDCYVQIGDGKILGLHTESQAMKVPDRNVLHVPGALVAPGFVDLHIHGARGRDFMDGTMDSLQTLSETLARHGTTCFLPTTMSAPEPDILSALRGFVLHRKRIEAGAVPLGIHMEGPFLNPVCRGTHDARYLKPADVLSLRRWREVSQNSILKITVAPEMDRNLALVREAAAAGIQISIGHSNATVEQARSAVDAGARQATHTFNAMRPFHQREPGILGQVLTDERVFTEVICDGIHVHPTALRLLLTLKGVDRMLLITDGLSAIDMPDGSYPLGDKMIVVERGECHDPEGRLAGSTLTLDRAVRNLVEWFDLPLHEALTAASATPARSMGIIGEKGVVAPGADADLVFLDAGLNVMKTMVGGRIVYSRGLQPAG